MLALEQLHAVRAQRVLAGVCSGAGLGLVAGEEPEHRCVRWLSSERIEPAQKGLSQGMPPSGQAGF